MSLTRISERLSEDHRLTFLGHPLALTLYGAKGLISQGTPPTLSKNAGDSLSRAPATHCGPARGVRRAAALTVADGWQEQVCSLGGVL